jgi:hypothetical protein
MLRFWDSSHRRARRPLAGDKGLVENFSIGQVQRVSITSILTCHTIEEKMMELKKRELALYCAVLNLERSPLRRSLAIRALFREEC